MSRVIQMGKLRYYVVYYDADLYAVDWDGGTGCNGIEIAGELGPTFARPTGF